MRPRRGLTVAVVASAWMISLAPLAEASESPRPKAAAAAAVHACEVKRTGVLRIIRAGTACGPGQIRVSWGLRGPAGRSGTAGPHGSRGHEGPLGPDGIAGATGPTGPTVAGAAGAAGAEGPTGVTGATGVNGAAGLAGARGPSGAAGATGATGAGTEGQAGPSGPSGPSGTGGVTGPEGPALPASLPLASTETGVWDAVTTEVEPRLVPRQTDGIVAFPIPLGPAALAESKVHYVPAAKVIELETVAGSAQEGCVSSTATPIAGLLLHPRAESGNLCIYVGVEELTNDKESGVVTVQGGPGATRTGAVVVFDVIEGAKPAQVRAQGSWAVTG